MARAMKDSGIEWIGEIPEEWKVLPAQRGFFEIRRKNTDGAVQNALKFKFGTIIPKSNFDADSDDYVADTITTYTVVEPGTVMINGLNLNYDFKTERTGLVRETGVITSAYLALKPKASMIIPEYATYLFKGYETRMALHNMGAGIRLTLGFKEFKKQPVLFPPLSEQRRIADFLDRRCAEIDGIIAATQKTIEEYKALKQSIITEAVTRGVRGPRPMKDSGIEWIGEIGEGFEVKKLKYLCYILDQYRSPITADQRNQNAEVLYDYYGASGVIDKIDGYTIDDHVMLIGEDGANLRMRNLPLMYEVNGKAWINNHAHILKPKKNVDFYFLFYVLEALDLNPYITGSAQPKLSQESLRNILIPTPSYYEQEEIADYLNKRLPKLNAMIDKKKGFIAELEAFRKTIIYEYVTGKKEVN